MSPLLAVTAESNGLVLATAARFTVPVVPVVNGPVASGRAKKRPGATSGAAKATTELLPNDMPRKSGSPNAQDTSIVIGTVPWAATASALVLVGISQLGWANSDSGNVTPF